MIEVLEPLEVADSDTSSIAEDVRKELNALSQQDLLALQSSGPISSLHNQLCLESIGVVHVD